MLLLFFLVLFVEFVRIQPSPDASSAPVLPNQDCIDFLRRLAFLLLPALGFSGTVAVRRDPNVPEN